MIPITFFVFRGSDPDRSLDRASDGDPLLRDSVLVGQVGPKRLRPFEDPEELDDQRVPFQLEKPVSALGRSTGASQG